MLDPLRQMSTGTPLEDARHLAQRYSRMRQEAETQVCGHPSFFSASLLIIYCHHLFKNLCFSYGLIPLSVHNIY